MATIRSYRTKRGDGRYEVRFRDPEGRQRSRSFSVHKDAQGFKLDVERKHQAGILYAAPPERFGAYAKAWLERFERGAQGVCGHGRARSSRLAKCSRSLLL
jgi:hypothetical protein